MKKLILLSIFALCVVSCSKENELLFKAKTNSNPNIDEISLSSPSQNSSQKKIDFVAKAVIDINDGYGVKKLMKVI